MPIIPRALADQVSMYQEWMHDRHGCPVQVVSGKKLEAIRAADLCICPGPSSAIPEIMILERPVIQIPRTDEDLTYTDADGIVIAPDERLEAEIQRLLQNPQSRADVVERQNAALPRLNSENDGRATSRVATLILQLAGVEGSLTELSAGPQLSSRTAPGAEQTRRADSSTEPSPRSLKILEVVHAFPPDSFSGTELYTHNLAGALGELGHRVTVLYPVCDTARPLYDFAPATYQGVNVVRFNRGPIELEGTREFMNQEFDAPFREFLRSEGFDIVHFQHLWGLSASWIATVKAEQIPIALKLDDMFFYCRSHHLVNGTKHCAAGPEHLDKCFACINGDWTTEHSDVAASRFAELAFRRGVLRRTFSLPDFVQCASRFLKEDTARHGLRNDNLEVIHTGIAPFDVKARCPSANGKIRIGYLGAIHPRKGLQYLLAAMERLASSCTQRGVPLNVELVVRGYPTDDENLSKVLEAAIQSGDHVKYRGPFQPDSRAEILAELDVLAVPSLGENYPFIIREALYAGVPVIATRIAGVPEIVEDGKNGFLCDPGDVGSLHAILEAIAAKPEILRTLDPSPDRIKLISEEARELTESLVRVVDRVGQRGEDALRSVIEQGKALLEASETDKAATLFSEARQTFGDHPRVLLGLGVAAFRQGDMEGAFRALSAAHALDPLDPDIVVSWAAVADKLGRVDELSDPIARAHRAVPEDPELRQLHEAVNGV
jgi:glycosyltransferase involved in cell wall biosynthesis